MTENLVCNRCGYKSKNENEFIPLDDDKSYCRNCARDMKHEYLNTVQTGEF